jgi:hypothetical protein
VLQHLGALTGAINDLDDDRSLTVLAGVRLRLVIVLVAHFAVVSAGQFQGQGILG